MSLRHFLPWLLIGLLVVTSTGGVLAQGNGPGGPEAPGALAGPGFNYQGELCSGGGPLTATCDFQFGLWNAFRAGTQMGGTHHRARNAAGGARNRHGFAPSVITGRADLLLLAGLGLLTLGGLAGYALARARQG
jgi:hypothetical protein